MTTLNPHKICVAILNYNGREHLERFLPQVLESVPKELLLIIDNNSDDESLQFLQQNYPELQVKILQENYGFAEGYNRGLVDVESAYVLLLNSDVAPEKGFLEILLTHVMAGDDIAAVQPSVLSHDRPDEYEYAGAAGGLLDVFAYPLCRGRIFDHLEKYNPDYKDTEIFWATGCCMLVKTDLFKKAGGFAEHYFAHLEEIDLCWRFKRMGYRIEVATDAKVFHLGGGTLSYQSAFKTFLNFRNSLYTIFRNERIGRLLYLLPLRLLLDFVATGMFLLKGEMGNARAVFRANRHYFYRLPKLLEERGELKKLVGELGIGPDRSSIGRLKKSIVWNYYLLGRRNYSEIDS